MASIGSELSFISLLLNLPSLFTYVMFWLFLQQFSLENFKSLLNKRCVSSVTDSWSLG